MIPPINLIPLHNAEYLTFMDFVLETTDDPSTAAAVRAARAVLQSWQERIRAAHVAEDESELSKMRRAYDADRDRHYSSLAQLAELFTRHPLAEKAAAGRLLSGRLGDYGTVHEVTDQGLNDETGDIDSILRDLETPEMTAAITLLGGLEWLEELKTAQSNFKAKSMERSTERGRRSAQNPDDIDTLRKEATKAYRTLVKKINAFHETDEGAAPWAGIVQKLNARIAETRQILAARRGRAAAGASSDTAS